MVEVKKILACIDLSEYSEEVLDYAITLARMFRAEVVIINVINKREIDAVSTAGQYYPELVNVATFMQRAKADRRSRIETLLNSVFSGNGIGTAIRIQAGVPFEEILLAINEEKVNLVVLGNKGRTNLARTLLGSHAEKVFRHSPVPVLNVRNRQKFTEAAERRSK
ncbi:MAG: universal stress protein [Desulfofustis sp.]|nr:universal stress protein [Desulfofustis sp.]